MPFAILWPTFALVALIFVVWLTLFFQRGGHIRRHPPTPENFATTESATRYFQPVELASNNFSNLFEIPVLYFALVPLLLITHHAGHIQVILAWVFVILRVLHSYVHIVVRNPKIRMPVYALGVAVLLAMWIVFAVDMIHAASVYDAAISNMQGP